MLWHEARVFGHFVTPWTWSGLVMTFGLIDAKIPGPRNPRPGKQSDAVTGGLVRSPLVSFRHAKIHFPFGKGLRPAGSGVSSELLQAWGLLGCFGQPSRARPTPRNCRDAKVECGRKREEEG